MSSTGVYDESFRLIPAEQMQLRPTEWLVEGLIEAATTVALFGPPGAAKSFYALDIACSVATGTPFHGREVLEGAVIYVAGEGFNGIARRLEAWAVHTGRRPQELNISNKALDLYYSAGAERLQDEIERVVFQTGVKPGLVIVDTLARNFSGDENSAGDIGQFLSNLDTVRHKWSCTVLIVHHTGKDPARGARGSSAIQGAVDAAFEFTRSHDDMIRVASRKTREGKDPEDQGYQLVDVKSFQPNGEVIQSAVLNSVDACEMTLPTGKNQRKALEILQEMYDETDCKNITIDVWRQRGMAAGLDPKRIREASMGLIRAGFVVLDGDRVSLPEQAEPARHDADAAPAVTAFSPDRCQGRFSAPHDTL